MFVKWSQAQSLESHYCICIMLRYSCEPLELTIRMVIIEGITIKIVVAVGIVETVVRYIHTHTHIYIFYTPFAENLMRRRANEMDSYVKALAEQP